MMVSGLELYREMVCRELVFCIQKGETPEVVSLWGFEFFRSLGW